jgi:hypothetical protein
MSKINALLKPVDKGPLCEACPAIEQCPAMKLAESINELNHDLQQDGLSDVIKTRVQGEIFAYGLRKFSSEIDKVNSTVSTCLGAVAINDKEFRYPSMTDVTEFGSKDSLWEGSELRDLVRRGFELLSQRQGISDLYTLSRISDPNEAVRARLSDIGYTASSGLRGKILDFRKAASYICKND